jgi:thiosulfate/3-mercaptopyruvate sulfurtransferase
VDGDLVASKIGVAGTVIVDARTPAFYEGTQTGGGQQAPHKTGHITSAVNVPFQSLLAADGRFKSADEMRGLFSAAGVKSGDQVITYCHIGQQATVALFAARVLGINAQLYDGSFEDWSRRPNAPVSVKK